MAQLSGVIAPATAPFDKKGDIDFDSFIKQIDWLIKEGVAGIAIGGSTGEGHTLNDEETRDLIAAGNDAASGRVAEQRWRRLAATFALLAAGLGGALVRRGARLGAQRHDAGR